MKGGFTKEENSATRHTAKAMDGEKFKSSRKTGCEIVIPLGLLATAFFLRPPQRLQDRLESSSDLSSLQYNFTGDGVPERSRRKWRSSSLLQNIHVRRTSRWVPKMMTTALPTAEAQACQEEVLIHKTEDSLVASAMSGTALSGALIESKLRL